MLSLIFTIKVPLILKIKNQYKYREYLDKYTIYPEYFLNEGDL
ncbi:hypothetical protein PMI13_01342 [Chryseobacterium populi]|uniref:Uncharacterized protein n=1 Tax=Chryseobacterium populi TaxID=1144316 RepID=J3CLB8_9FLAO|nr:hypothetical protein PMI13_01342 [Chryseobacterium populi]